GRASWMRTLGPGEKATFRVAYRSRGTSRWDYLLGVEGEARNFRLALTTDFARVDFPAGTVSPTRHAQSGNGWSGTWEFVRLVSSRSIGVELPQRLNPGPLASRITFFAPVSLLFFFFVVALMAEVRQRPIHPLNYFFFGCAFFAFHLLLAYLVDHVQLGVALALASAVSLLLSVTYARLFTGWRFALRELGLSQLVYLVLFSLTFLLEGFTGLAITVGAIVTLFLMMQVTGGRELLAVPRRVREPDTSSVGET
ncbi:MAG: cell envelope integrity protein CreD, partial [Myxococcaceae bacterium]|nr:cell envelope integrity protein CreD [Myxococcaceae bacterium]